MDYFAVIETAPDASYSAYVPDLPGCVSSGDSQDEVRRLIEDAVALHIDSLRRRGGPVPPPGRAKLLLGRRTQPMLPDTLTMPIINPRPRS